MRLEIDVEYNGFFKRMANDLKNTSFLKDSAEKVKNDAQGNLLDGDHIDTWGLYNSIQVEKTIDGYEVVAGDDYQWYNAPDGAIYYASYGEEGTSKMRAWPYMEPALRENENNIEKDVYQWVSGIVKRA